MKNLNKLFVGLILVSAFVSCEKEGADDSQILKLGDKKGGVGIEEVTLSSPSSDNGVDAYLIPFVDGKNDRGGNRTCVDVESAFMIDAEFSLCGDKIDYEEGSFAGAFPEGLNVTTEGIFVSFEMDGCLEIGGSYYKVGAVIVKGSDQANIYFYPEGTIGDSNLAAPINSSGGPAGLSNLTFCFVECEVEVEPIIISVKTYYWPADSYVPDPYGQTRGMGLSSGVFEFNSTDWCRKLGFFAYPEIISESIIAYFTGENIGTVSVAPAGPNAITVTVQLKDGGLMDNVWVYAGSKAGLIGDGCPDYSIWPNQVVTTPVNTVPIKDPLTDKNIYTCTINF